MCPKFVHSPSIYRAIDRQVRPRTDDWGNCADTKAWLLYVAIAALSQLWAPDSSVFVNAVWMLVTAFSLWAVTRSFSTLRDFVKQALAAVKFSDPLVWWLGPGSVAWPSRRSAAPVTGDADPARPLPLRV